MCGLVGVAGSLDGKDERLTRILLLLDYYRGIDATGFAAIRLNDDIHYAKINSHPFDLFDMSKFKMALNGMGSKAFMGHNRATTRGVNTSHNAHPFVFDHIVGMHNGTLDLDSHRALEKELGETFAVDSAALLAGIAKFGLKDAMSLVSGAYSLVWYDTKERTLNMLRNKERPMNYAYTEDFKRIIWASQWEMIDSAVTMVSGYKLYDHQFKDSVSPFFQTDEDWHYKFDLDGLRKGERPKPKVCKVEGKKPPEKATDNWSAEDWENYFPLVPTRDNQSQSGYEHGKGSGSVISLHGPNAAHATMNGSPINSSSVRTSGLRNMVGGPTRPFANFIDEETYADMARRGCAFCGKEIKFQEVGQVVIEKMDTVIGPCCSGESKINRVYTKHDLYLN